MPEDSDTGAFFPRGAVAFLVLMIVFYAGFWFAMYYLMTQRG